MRIEIVNWERYNPRNDVKHTSWFRLENSFWSDPLLTPLNNGGKLIWLLLLSFASQRMNGVIVIDVSFIATIVRMSKKRVNEVIKHFEVCGKIVIHDSNPTNSTLRTRVATDGRTDETDVTNVTPLNPPSDEVGIKPKNIRSRLLNPKAQGIAAKAIGAIRHGCDSAAAETYLGSEGYMLLLAKFGTWESFHRAYAVATAIKRSGGSDATVFEAQLVQSIKALLLEAPADYEGPI